MDKLQSPKLAPPGAGLPWLENFFLKYFYFPNKLRQSSWAGNLNRFSRESEKIIHVCQKMNEQDFQTRILIPRLKGMEDSSRFWSVALTVDHLMITMRGMSMIALELGAGKTVDVNTDVAKVKPKQENVSGRDQMMKQFREISDEVVGKLKALEKNHSNKNRVMHPWFGQITCEGWVWVLAQHQAIHRKQIQLIMERL